MMLDNKKIETIIGMLIPLILDSEKYKKMLSITNCTKLWHHKHKIHNSPKLSLLKVTLMISLIEKIRNLAKLLI